MVALKRILFLLVFGAISLTSMTGYAVTDAQKMERARLQFASGNFTEAIQIYSTIPVASDFWLDSIEEKAWSHTRQGQYENALGDLQTVTSSVWSSQVGPETYVLSTFVSLKICDYKMVVKKIDLFKKRMLPRVDALEKLITEPVPNEFWKLAESLKAGTVTMMSLGKNAEKFPRYFFRDQQIIEGLKSGQGQIVEKRMKQLAKLDLEEISLNLKKMKMIDVQVIQKILMADQVDKLPHAQISNLKFSAIDRDQQLLFPVTDDEIWIDEVGHFQVKADKCPKVIRSSL